MDTLRHNFCSDLYRPHTTWASDGPYTRVELECGTLCIIISAIWRSSIKPNLIHVSFTPLPSQPAHIQALRFEQEFFPSEIHVERRPGDDRDNVTAYTLTSSSNDDRNTFSYVVDSHRQIYDLSFDTDGLGHLNIQVNLSNNTPHSLLGPLHLARYFPWPTQWHVFSTQSSAVVRIISESDTILETTGLGHQEKNFGASFPTAWIWVRQTVLHLYYYISERLT